MSNFTGMDIQAVRDLATQLTNKAGEIDSLRQQLTGKIDGTPWVGADRERFHNDWSSRHSVALTQVADAYAALRSEDPARAAALAPADSTRVARALEVVRSTGRPLAEWQQQRVGGIADSVTLHPAILLPPRAWLYERCDRRFALMLDRGALDEVAALLARGLDPALPVMRAIGVPECAALLKGTVDRAEAERRGAQATRNYAKRQYTWFRRQPPLDWPRVESIDYDLNNLFASLLRI